ncbi:MAG: PEP/pyruvate-binding domain-containing protein [Waddliaceae bacterium]
MSYDSVLNINNQENPRAAIRPQLNPEKPVKKRAHCHNDEALSRVASSTFQPSSKKVKVGNTQDSEQEGKRKRSAGTDIVRLEKESRPEADTGRKRLNFRQEENLFRVAAPQFQHSSSEPKVANARGPSEACDRKRNRKEKTEQLDWLKAPAIPMTATPENLDHFAIDLGYGYKSANLLVLQNQTEEINKQLKTAQVKVPAFLPISDCEMSNHLCKEIPQVFTLWQEFLQKGFDNHLKHQFIHAESQENAAQSKLKITELGKDLLKQIQKEIRAHFKERCYDSPQMNEWLEKENPEFVIIRSTGKEDSEKISNAGGNASIPYVKPNKKAISEAIGEVIASYFGEKSISQRILCGDQSLFAEDKPFVPILMQEMIGESVAGHGSKEEDIPRSGVLFTRQSDKAEGVTLIQAGLGNNEGIVSCRVGVDSYFVKGRKIHAVVRKKETRFVSRQQDNGAMTVAPIKNHNPILEQGQALPSNIILALKSVANTISKNYAKENLDAKPMDIEYTVRLKEEGSDRPMIYLLQARPLLGTQGENRIEPTYLDFKALQEHPQKNQFHGDVLLDGNAYVRTITDSNAVIFAEDLPKGGLAYSHADNPAGKKVMVIRKTAPTTSHEAVILRPKGIAVLVISDAKQFASLRIITEQVSEEAPLLVDTQRGLLLYCSNQMVSENMIKKGMISYPIPLEVSVPTSRIMNIPKEHDYLTKGILLLFNKESERLIKNLQGNRQLLPIMKKGIDGNGYTVRKLIELMATEEAECAKLALATLLRLLKNHLVNSMNKTEDFRKNINQPLFQVFEAVIDLAKREVISALEVYPAQSLERLYPIKFLEALIFQQSKENVLGCHSFSQTLALDRIQRGIIRQAEQNGVHFHGPHAEILIYLYRLSNQAYSEKCREDWQQFVAGLMQMETWQANNCLNELIPLISSLNTLNITDKWVNIEFAKAWKIHAKKKKRMEAVIADLKKTQQSDDATFRWIKERLGILSIYQQNTTLWESPEYSQKNVFKLIATITTDLGFDKDRESQHSLLKLYDNSTPFGRLAVLQYIRDSLICCDHIVKSVKGSNQFQDDRQKAIRVAALVRGLLEIMETVFQLLSKEDQEEMKIYFDNMITTNDYIKKLKSGCEYDYGYNQIKKRSIGFDNLVQKLNEGSLENHCEQLEARELFVVNALVIGSRANLACSVLWPERLEEYFTLFHQNSEQVIKSLNVKNGLRTDLLWEGVKEISDQLKKKFDQDVSYMNLEEGKLYVGYQIPIGEHSASVVVAYNIQAAEGFELKLQMFGFDLYKRWEKVATFGTVLAYKMGCGFADDSPPQINCFNVLINLKFPADFEDHEELVDALDYIINDLTKEEEEHVSGLLDCIENGWITKKERAEDYVDRGMRKVAWEDLNPDCFKYTLHVNENLISRLLRKGKKEVAAKVAINSIRGLAYYGLAYYDLEDYSWYENYIESTDSLKNCAVDTLVMSIKEEPNVRVEIQRLSSDPEVRKRFPDVCKTLNNELFPYLVFAD